jgi:hypothetical protein
MIKSSVWRAFLIFVLACGPISARSGEVVASLDNPKLEIASTSHVTAERDHVSASRHGSPRGGTLDIVFLLSSGLLGFLLLRRVNKKS